MQPDIIATVAAITVICYLLGMGCKATGKIDKPKLREIYAGAHIVEDQNKS